MPTNWERDLSRMRESLGDYLTHLQDILRAANTGEVMSGAIVHLKRMHNPKDFDKFDGYDVYVDMYQSVSGDGTEQDYLPELLRWCAPANLKKNTVYSATDVKTVGYVRCFAETPDGAYCIYIERKCQDAEESFLHRTKAGWHECKTDASFGDTIVHNVLKGVIPSLHGEYSNSSQYFQSQKRLAAGKQFVSGLLKKVSGKDGREIYENLNHVSALAYESQANHGKMVIMPLDDLNSLKSQLKISLTTPVAMTSHKGVRKLFEIASGGGLCLVCDGKEIHGLISSTKCEGKHLLILMHGHLNWEILEYGKEGSQKAMPRIAFDGTNFVLKDSDKNQKAKDDISRKLSEIPKKYRKSNSACVRCRRNEECKLHEKSDLVLSKKNMDKVIEAATEQRHGTTIVFSKYAKEEAERLKNTSFQINVKELWDDSTIIKQLTTIDGAVLCDFEGNCYAIGVILDGQTVDNESAETIERGARFNSAIRYKNAFPCSVICIVSEDGYVNVV